MGLEASRSNGRAFATLDHALQDKPGLRASLARAERFIGDRRRPMYDHGKKVDLACANYGIIDLGEAEKNSQSDHRVAFEDGLHHQLRNEPPPPYFSGREKEGLVFFNELRGHDETRNWAGYERSLEAHKDVIIAMYVRMADILLSATDPHLAQELASLPKHPNYPGPEALPAHKMATAQAALVFYAPFASYLSEALYCNLMDTSMSVLHPRSYKVVEDEIERQKQQIEATDAFLRRFFESELLPSISALGNLVKIIGWKIRRKARGSTLAKILYKKRVQEDEITESTIGDLLDEHVPDIEAVKAIFEDKSPSFLGIGLAQGLCENLLSPHAVVVKRRQNLFTPTALGQRQSIVKFRPRERLMVPFEIHFRTAEMERDYHFGRPAHVLHKDRTIASVVAQRTISEAMVRRTRDYLARLGKIDAHAPTALSAAAALTHSTMKIVTTIRDGNGYAGRTFYFPPGATVADLIAASVNLQKNGAIVQLSIGDIRTTSGSRLKYRQSLDLNSAYMATLTTPGFNKRTLLELRDSSNTTDAKVKYGIALERS